MEYFPKLLDPSESAALLDRIQDHFHRHGYGFWAVEMKESRAFAGIVGLGQVGFPAPFAPCVEIAWRLLPEFWGRGIAFEAAQRAVSFGFQELKLEEIVAFTVPQNLRSIALMQRLGMQRDSAEDFDHPLVPEGPLKRHVLYRLRASL